MTESKAELIALEAMMTEFFEGATENERRKEIEKVLSDFSSQQGSWKLCLNFLAHTQNQFVTMYCLNTIESVINKQWMGLPWEGRVEIKTTLYTYVLANHGIMAPCTRCKSVKLVVDIARLDWPHFYPDFLTNILQLLQKTETRQLGLVFILTTSEELLTPREDLSMDRKAELKQLILTQMPHIFAMLLELLSNNSNQINNQECFLLLKVLSHLFSWVPASYVSSEVLIVIFKLASDHQNHELSVLAVCTLNEMLYRHWAIPNWENFLNQTLHFVQTLLGSDLKSMDSEYLEKISNFLGLVLSSQACKGDSIQHFLLDKLLSSTLSFTLQQPTLDPGFLSCLDVWSSLLENSVFLRYPSAMVTLAQEILCKVQFRKANLETMDQLSELDNVNHNDDGETQWEQFLRRCIEVVARLAELQPQAILKMVFEDWVELCNTYGQICSLQQIPSEPHDVAKLTGVLRDLCTYTQTLGRLQPVCSGPDWLEEPYISISRLTVQHLLTMCDLAVKNQVRPVSDSVKICFQNVHAQVLAALKAWCHWLAHLHEDPAAKSFLSDIVSAILRNCVSLLGRDSPTLLQHCSAHLLSTLTFTVRPKALWEQPTVKNLYSSDISYLQVEDQYLVHAGLFNSLVLSWQKSDDQLWDQRSKLLTSYIEELTAPLLQQSLHYSVDSKPTIIRIMRLLQHVVQLYKSEGSKVKKLLCAGVQRPVEQTLALFQVYVKDPDVNQVILGFFLVLLECLQQQVGVTFTQVIVQTLMVAFTREQQHQCLAHDTGGGLQQLLEMLDLIMQTPGLSASKLTPMAVDLCLQLAEPVLRDSSAPSVREALFQLAFSLLLHKWQYFFKPTAESDLRNQEFLLMMKAMGQALFLPEINLFRQVIRNLEALNIKWKLYRKDLFRQDLHQQFLTVLFDTLRNKTHSLLNEEIALFIFNLISADVNFFFVVFLPQYLDAVNGIESSHRQILLKNFTRETDMPSTIQNIHRLVNDIICYQLCSSSLSSGSIKF